MRCDTTTTCCAGKRLLITADRRPLRRSPAASHPSCPFGFLPGQPTCIWHCHLSAWLLATVYIYGARLSSSPLPAMTFPIPSPPWTDTDMDTTCLHTPRLIFFVVQSLQEKNFKGGAPCSPPRCGNATTCHEFIWDPTTLLHSGNINSCGEPVSL